LDWMAVKAPISDMIVGTKSREAEQTVHPKYINAGR
jgi:hypothetical protein